MTPESEYWFSLARHVPLGILTDLDGTLLPFAATPTESPEREVGMPHAPGIDFARASSRTVRITVRSVGGRTLRDRR